MKLAKIRPLVVDIYSTDKSKGLSSSEVQRIKEAHKNKNQPLLQRINNASLYETIYQPVGAKGSTSRPIAYKLEPGDFDVLPDIANRNEESAWYGMAINYRDTLKKEIKALSIDEISQAYDIKFEGGEYPVQPQLKSALIKGSIHQFCAMDKAESMIQAMGPVLIEAIGYKRIKSLLQMEARASVYGKQCNQEKASFLRKLSMAEEIVDRGTSSTHTKLILVHDKLVYDLDECVNLLEVDESITSKYTVYQKNRNSQFKLIKDTAEELQRKNDEEYQNELSTWSAAVKEHNAHTLQYNAAIEAMRSTLLKELASYVIRKA